MSDFVHQAKPEISLSAICCPQGAIIQNGICYCTKEQALAHPNACRVICDSLTYTLPPSNGGCKCPKGFAGDLCDQKPCYIYDLKSETVKYYCLDDVVSSSTTVTTNMVKDCSNVGNLSPNFTTAYSSCPCFHGAARVFKNESEGGVYSCLCPKPYVGDLCHIEPYDALGADTTDPYTANTFLAIIAFSILVMTLVICCGRWHQRRKRKRLENCDFHRHYVSRSEYGRRRRATDFLANYVPVFPMFLSSSPQETTLTKKNGDQKKKNGTMANEIQLQEITIKDSGAKSDNHKNTMIYEEMHDHIKKGPS